MCERLLDKSVMPDEKTIQEYLGRQSHERLTLFENRLKAGYQLVRELKFPKPCIETALNKGVCFVILYMRTIVLFRDCRMSGCGA